MKYTLPPLVVGHNCPGPFRAGRETARRRSQCRHTASSAAQWCCRRAAAGRGTFSARDCPRVQRAGISSRSVLPRAIERAHRTRHEDRDRGARQGNARDAPGWSTRRMAYCVHLGAVPWFHITVLVPPECEQEQHHVMVLQLRSETALHANSAFRPAPSEQAAGRAASRRCRPDGPLNRGKSNSSTPSPFRPP